MDTTEIVTMAIIGAARTHPAAELAAVITAAHADLIGIYGVEITRTLAEGSHGKIGVMLRTAHRLWMDDPRPILDACAPSLPE